MPNALKPPLTKYAASHCSFKATRYRSREGPIKGNECKNVWWENAVYTTMTWRQSWATASLSQVCHHTTLCSQPVKKKNWHKKTIERIKASNEHEINLMASTMVKSELLHVGLPGCTDFVLPKNVSHHIETSRSHLQSHKEAHSLCITCCRQIDRLGASKMTFASHNKNCVQ